MGRPIDALKLINENVNRINPQYDLSMSDALKIKRTYTSPLSVAAHAFVLGYVQGVKAQKAGKAYIKEI